MCNSTSAKDLSLAFLFCGNRSLRIVIRVNLIIIAAVLIIVSLK